jgi:diacylglycerol kinase family enzyme
VVRITRFGIKLTGHTHRSCEASRYFSRKSREANSCVATPDRHYAHAAGVPLIDPRTDSSIFVILNSNSTHRRDGIKLEFKRAGVDPQVIELDGALSHRLKTLLAMPDHARVIAAGGDGTVHAVASKLAGTGIAMGVLPLGTRNHFARDLGIPTDLGAAVDTALHGRLVAVDAGRVNGQIFVNNASLGIYPRIANEGERQRRAFAPRTWWNLLRATIRAFRQFGFIRVRVTLKMADSHSQTNSHGSVTASGKPDQLFRRTPLLFVGNNEYEIEGIRLGQRLHLDQGTLMLVIAHPHGKAGLIRMAIRAIGNRLRTDKDVDVFLSDRFDVYVHNRKRIRIALDGEVITLIPPLHFEIVESALRVMVPASPADG